MCARVARPAWSCGPSTSPLDRTSMERLKVFLLFILVAILAAGLFGAIHDQISYSVSSEYYTRFKLIALPLVLVFNLLYRRSARAI